MANKEESFRKKNKSYDRTPLDWLPSMVNWLYWRRIYYSTISLNLCIDSRCCCCSMEYARYRKWKLQEWPQDEGSHCIQLSRLIQTYAWKTRKLNPVGRHNLTQTISLKQQNFLTSSAKSKKLCKFIDSR
jgi:hypothetical protein